MRAGAQADGSRRTGRRACDGSAAAAVRDYLLEQVSALHWAVADGDVHDARVACRRARSVLMVHVELFAAARRAEVVGLAARARDLGRELSTARDAEVVEEVLHGWAAEEGWPRDRLDRAVRLLSSAGGSEVAVDRARDRLLALSDQVAALASAPLWGPAGAEPVVPALGTTRAQELARLARRVGAARAAGADPARDERWHDVRKAAKRLRYTAEVGHRSGDLRAGAEAAAARRLQTALGDLQDLQQVRVRLDEVAAGALADGELALLVELGRRADGTSGTARADVDRALADMLGAVVGGSRCPSTPLPEDHVVTLPADTDPAFTDYAHPERLVSTQWLQDHLGQDGLVVVESDEDVLLYETGHIPGAVKIDWHLDLNDPVTRDYVDGTAFARLMGAKGVGRDTTVVVYGDKNNWWAAYALWVFSLFGHQDVRLLDGGRAKWEAEGRDYTTEVAEPTPVDYPVVERDDASIRAFLDDVRAHLGRPMVDVRSPEEYTGERTHMPAYPEEGALRGGHIPGAQSVPWARAAAEDGTFRRRAELEAIYQDEKGLSPSDDVVAYCRIGERSSHTWFVLTHLLGFDRVRNYDGSWTEWGNVVRVPIVKGAEPGSVPGEVPSR